MREENPLKRICFGVPLGQIAGVIEAEGGFFAGKCHAGLLGIAQAMLDMAESGRYGTGLERVLRYHFRPPKERFHEECLRAAVEVFEQGVRRLPGEKILYISPLHGRVRFRAQDGTLPLLGYDAASPFRGRRYYGTGSGGKAPKKEAKEGRALK